MKDRFKFRVWNNEKRSYEDSDGCLIGNTGHLYFDSCEFAAILSNKRYIIEQCTGLKDSTGKLIYEGDEVIVDIKYRGDDFSGGYTLREKRIVEWVTNRWSICPSQSPEIIGNIHEEVSTTSESGGEVCECGNPYPNLTDGDGECINCGKPIKED